MPWVKVYIYLSLRKKKLVILLQKRVTLANSISCMLNYKFFRPVLLKLFLVQFKKLTKISRNLFEKFRKNIVTWPVLRGNSRSRWSSAATAFPLLPRKLTTETGKSLFLFTPCARQWQLVKVASLWCMTSWRTMG